MHGSAETTFRAWLTGTAAAPSEPGQLCVCGWPPSLLPGQQQSDSAQRTSQGGARRGFLGLEPGLPAQSGHPRLRGVAHPREPQVQRTSCGLSPGSLARHLRLGWPDHQRELLASRIQPLRSLVLVLRSLRQQTRSLRQQTRLAASSCPLVVVTIRGARSPSISGTAWIYLWHRT